jgi:hypothetical protein
MEVHQVARKELSARGCLISLSKTMALGLKSSCDFPVFFPVKREFWPEAGSLVTGATAITDN